MKTFFSGPIRIIALHLTLLLTGCVGHTPGTMPSQTVLENVSTYGTAGSGFVDPDNVLWGGAIYSEKFDFHSLPLENYVNSIADRLVQKWPITPPPYRIRLIYGNNLDAHATVNNVIFFSSGWINGAKSEDEIAAVIAHELSHILLQHPLDKGARIDSSENLNTLRQYATLGLTLKDLDIVKRGKSLNVVYGGGAAEKQELEAAYLAGAALYETKKLLLDPYFTRGQEEEADFLAIDLLVHAGYNPTVMRDQVMDRLKAYREELRKKEEQEEKAFQLYRARADDAAQNLLLSGQLNKACDQFLSSFAMEMERSLTQTVAEGNKEHFKPDVRRRQIKKYLKTHYPDRTKYPKKNSKTLVQLLKKTHFNEIQENHIVAEAAASEMNRGKLSLAEKNALKSIRSEARNSPYPWFVLGQIHARQRHGKRAEQDFVHALGFGGCSPEVYSKIAELHAGQEEYNQAYSILSKGVEDFDGDFGPFYLDYAKTSLVEGNLPKFFQIVEECRQYPDKIISEQCRTLQATVKKENISQRSASPAISLPASKGTIQKVLKTGLGIIF